MVLRWEKLSWDGVRGVRWEELSWDGVRVGVRRYRGMVLGWEEVSWDGVRVGGGITTYDIDERSLKKLSDNAYMYMAIDFYLSVMLVLSRKGWRGLNTCTVWYMGSFNFMMA